MSAPAKDLKRVERAAAKVAAAQLELDRAMRDAQAAGVALRPIAAAAGVAVETARTRIARAAS
jgi:hypothetical protein